MTALRALLFNILFFVLTGALALFMLPVMVLPRAAIVRVGHLWAWLIGRVAALTVGIKVEVRGGVPRGACLVASKHQSAWETVAFLGLLDDACFVLKRELAWLPVFGLYILKNRQIVTDRGGGAKALRKMIADAKMARETGRQVVIFPEGTRVTPGQTRPYHPGVAGLYASLALPVVPVALNSGLFWGRRRFRKDPGTIIVSFLPPIPPGLKRQEFLTRLQQTIEAETAVLVAEAMAAAPRQSPHT